MSFCIFCACFRKSAMPPPPGKPFPLIRSLAPSTEPLHVHDLAVEQVQNFLEHRVATAAGRARARGTSLRPARGHGCRLLLRDRRDLDAERLTGAGEGRGGGLVEELARGSFLEPRPVELLALRERDQHARPFPL